MDHKAWTEKQWSEGFSKSPFPVVGFLASPERAEASNLNTPPATERTEKVALAEASEERVVVEEAEAGVREPRVELAVAVAVVGAVVGAVVVAAPVEEACRSLPCCIASCWICRAIPSPV